MGQVGMSRGVARKDVGPPVMRIRAGLVMRTERLRTRLPSMLLAAGIGA